MSICSKEEQGKRRKQIQDLHRQYCYDLYGDNGIFALERDVDWRGYLWHSLSFLNGEQCHISKANAMLRYIADKGGGDFWSSSVTMILSRFSEKLNPQLRNDLKKRLADHVMECSKSKYIGYNDNFPSMAALTVVVGSEILNMPEYTDSGLKMLEGLKAMLLRRGFISEYTSPTYSALTLTCLAEIVNLSENEQSRFLALNAEHRIWTEIASHFHRETSFLAGPHSRAYMVDMCGHLHNSHVVLYQVFGNALFINPLNAMFPYQEKQVLHGGIPEFMRSHVGWFTTTDFHVPDYAVELALKKSYPYTVKATSEYGAFPRNWMGKGRHLIDPLQEFQAGHTLLTTYMTEDFALGTATRPFLDSYQNTAFHLTYRRSVKKELQSVSTVFSRFVINDNNPHPDNYLIQDDGRPLIVSEGPSALVAYHGKPPWTARAPIENTDSVSSLKLSVIMTCFYGNPQEIWLGDSKYEDWSGYSKDSVSVYIKDGPVYMAIHPIVHTNYGTDIAISLDKVNGFGQVNLYSYKGVPRPFSDLELFSCMSGFVFEVSQAKEWSNFEDFRKTHSNFTISDEYYEGPAMREVSYNREGIELGLMISPISEGIKYASVNGRLLSEPKFMVSGFDSSVMPWM